jgi:hypothetical protein
MREIDYDEAWEVVSDDTDMLIEQVCEGYEKEVLQYLGLPEKYNMLTNKTMNELNAYKKAYSILMDWFDYIPEENQLEVHSKLGDLGL